ncbi:MAG: ABC transporter permease [Bacilli bacterium]|nr:ABC transporter permease [Bacilli bacterium]
MKQYFTYFKISFISGLQYRVSALAGLSTQFFFGFVFIMIYLAFYETEYDSAPMKFNELVTYLWLGQAFFSLMYLYHKDKELISMIRDGNISYELCRPQNLYWKWYIKIFSSKLSMVLLRFFPVIIIAFLLPFPYNLSLPNNMFSFIFFVISMIIGAFLVTSLSTMVHIIAFFSLDEKGIMSMFMVIADLFAGGIVPVLFLPKFLQLIADYLPFRYIFDLPYRIYSGNITGMTAVSNVLIQLLWVFVSIGIGYYLNKRILSKVEVQGG